MTSKILYLSVFQEIMVFFRLGDLITQLDKNDLEAVECSLETSLGMTQRTASLKSEISRLKNFIGKLLKYMDDPPNAEIESRIIY